MKYLQGLDEAVLRNIQAVVELSDLVRTSFGPNGAFFYFSIFKIKPDERTRPQQITDQPSGPSFCDFGCSDHNSGGRGGASCCEAVSDGLSGSGVRGGSDISWCYSRRGDVDFSQMGDSTNMVLILAGELLKKAEHLLIMGLHPSEIIRGYELACIRALSELESALL